MLAVLAGVICALGQPPLNLWPLALLALAAAVVLFSEARDARAAAWTGWAFGFGYFSVSMHWLVEPFLVDFATTGPLAPIGLFGMAAGLALFWAIAFWGAARIGGALALVVLWTLAELARAYALTGFPWGLVGYTLAPTPLVQWAQWIGPHGLTFATLGLAALLAARRGPPIASAAALFAMGWGGGVWGTAPLQDLTDRPLVRLVQPNAPQHLKWDPDYVPVFYQRLMAATAAGDPPAMVVWPETSLPMFLRHADEALAAVAERARGAEVVLGLQRYDAGFYNSALLLAADGTRAALYDKHHLVPFGEYMPLQWLFARIHVFGLAARVDSGYSAGPGPQVMQTALGIALPLICYEAVFPQDVTGVSTRPDYLLQITNDAWFGNWSGPYQHLMQARMRAIETGLPMVRVANTGVSAMIDPAGRITAQIALNTAGHIDAALPRPRPATLYSRSGDGPLALLLLLAAACLIVMGARNRH